MPLVCWDHRADGWFVIDLLVAGQVHGCRVDTGLVDRSGDMGLELNPVFYDGCLRANRLTPMQRRERRDASGRRIVKDCGIVQAQLFDTTLGIGVGPAVKLLAMRGDSGLDSRVGVVFFHRLAGCRVDWDLSARRWCVQYP